jgi:hypothetical protein
VAPGARMSPPAAASAARVFVRAGAQHPQRVGGQVGGDRGALPLRQGVAGVLHHRLDRLAVGETDDQSGAGPASSTTS